MSLRSPDTPDADNRLTERELTFHADKLKRELAGDVRFGRHDRMLYSTDASIYQVEPLGVVIPADLSDLRILIEYAAEHRLPILPAVRVQVWPGRRSTGPLSSICLRIVHNSSNSTSHRAPAGLNRESCSTI
jgi:hypothetical protein